jgi:hypothetical protein
MIPFDRKMFGDRLLRELELYSYVLISDIGRTLNMVTDGDSALLHPEIPNVYYVNGIQEELALLLLEFSRDKLMFLHDDIRLPHTPQVVKGVKMADYIHRLRNQGYKKPALCMLWLKKIYS